MSEPLDAESLAVRAELLDLGNRWKQRAAQLDELDDDDDSDDLDPSLSEAHERRNQLTRRYRQWLPEIPLTRDPHSGDALHWPLDPVDLDGWFWNYEAPVRRLPARFPRLWLTLTGAMRIAQPVTYTPFLCKPGPGAPYVVPRILEAPDVRAVISEVRVGRHTGWAIAYFGPRPGVRLENEWGTQEYYVYDDDGEWKGWSQNTPWPADWDFDLEPWLSSGRLLWIAPGDSTLTLRQGPASCPYLGIEGPHELAYIVEGTLEYH
ncbi:hypothetical protein ETD83_17580 [Actinomadura soli]|uniref:Uncharacterized protein n=1 Tax=Actinomadura soli TaxID=2508997 RepID=A0A5C4JCL9_9ACTN|nr:hypothetical protein [Actinomadura soli]TMQ99980.1 hypothetical protein ETD83_17580 [Actinomadura soli]